MRKINFGAPVIISLCEQQGCFEKNIEEFTFENGMLFQENESIFHDVINDLQALSELNGIVFLTAIDIPINKAIELFGLISPKEYPDVKNILSKLRTWAKKNPQNINMQIDDDLQALYKEYSQDEKKEYVIEISFQKKKEVVGIVKRNHTDILRVFSTENVLFSGVYEQDVSGLKPLHHHHNLSDYDYLKLYFPEEHEIFEDFESSFYYVINDLDINYK